MRWGEDVMERDEAETYARRRLAALYEAGKAASVLANGPSWERLSIREDDDAPDPPKGRSRTWDQMPPDPGHRMADLTLRSCFYGLAAQRLLGPGPGEPPSLIDALLRDENEGPLVNSLGAQANRKLRSAWVEELRRQEENLHRSAETFVKSYAPMIEAIAAALLEAGELDIDSVFALIVENYDKCRERWLPTHEYAFRHPAGPAPDSIATTCQGKLALLAGRTWEGIHWTICRCRECGVLLALVDGRYDARNYVLTIEELRRRGLEELLE